MIMAKVMVLLGLILKTLFAKPKASAASKQIYQTFSF